MDTYINYKIHGRIGSHVSRVQTRGQTPQKDQKNNKVLRLRVQSPQNGCSQEFYFYGNWFSSNLTFLKTFFEKLVRDPRSPPGAVQVHGC